MPAKLTLVGSPQSVRTLSLPSPVLTSRLPQRKESSAETGPHVAIEARTAIATNLRRHIRVSMLED
jgi:hypothetical protein